MIRPLWGLVGVALLGTAGVAGTVIVASSGGEEEIVQQVETATASPAATATPALSESPAPSPTPASTQGETITYTDPTYGYSFDYPATWYLSPAKGDGGVTTLYSYDPATVPPEDAGKPVAADKLKAEFLVLGNSEGLSTDAWIARNREGGGPVEVTSRSAVSVDNADGIAETANLAEGSAVQYFIPHGENMYVIANYPADSLLSSEFDAVLSTFKFNSTP